jgi:FtsP/CotA-like multicopper oxidase with cupredoxin domain
MTKRLQPVSLALGMALAFAPPLHAQSAPDIENPRSFRLVPLNPPPAPQVGSVQSTPADAREVSLEMTIDFLDRSIYNPATRSYDRVKVRGYKDSLTPDAPDQPLVAPTIDMVPGQTLRVKLNNILPKDPSCDTPHDDINIPHCFNGTNLHTHGLWINPAGNSDNVLISIRPGVPFEYEYNIPQDHAAGTFWYHPHLHGSTALQVGSGMAGAIIIRDDRIPSFLPGGGVDRPGDLDRLLVGANGAALPDRVLVLQQIQYACRYPDGPNKGEIQQTTDGAYFCGQNQVGGIEGYDQFGPGTWGPSGRYTSVNGQVLGNLAPARVGVPERWRMIHAGVRETINFEIRHKTTDAVATDLAQADTESWIEANCGAPVDYTVVAQDGLTMSEAQVRNQAVLQPGYRVDALVTFAEPGEYCVVDGHAPAGGAVDGTAPSRRLLGTVTATGTAQPEAATTAWLVNWLKTAAGRVYPSDVAARVRADLDDGFKLSGFVWHPDVGDDELTGTQTLVFNIDTSASPPSFEIDGEPYAPDIVPRKLMLDGVDEWTLQSDLAGHPFHIHVNPFQVVEILDAGGNDVSGIGATDDGDPQYAGLKGVWKDTLFVKNDDGKKYTVVVRTRYERYIGKFVLHCHILDHEDQGMMQNVEIYMPDGQGGIVESHGGAGLLGGHGGHGQSQP